MKIFDKKNRVFYFLGLLILFYIFLYFFKNNIFYNAFSFSINLFAKILLVLVLVFILMIFVNYFFSKKRIISLLDNKKKKSWLIAVLFGILSAGPIYVWYPLLADLKNKGMSYGLITCFLYNRAIKIQLIPIMFVYFNLKYVLILFLIMIFVSVIQGFIIDKINKKGILK